MSSLPSRIAGALSGHYELKEEIGAGGMATVYLAEDLRHDRRVALKVLRPELAAVIGAERFLAEIKLTANLQHPHILPLFDSGEADSFLFYVMPFIEGESLRDRLDREKQLPVDEAVRLGCEVASALDYAHRHGVIHRDIKPENILLHDGRALVADFGIALAASKAGGTRMTETGMSLGTPAYMSPEQAMGEREITARSDVYALGAVLYEMLTGDPPFTGSTAQAVVARVVTESPRPLTPQRHTIPPHVEAAVLTALEKLPADRFASAADFAAALTNPAFTLPGGSLEAAAVRAPGPWKRVAVLTGVLAAAASLVAIWALARGAGHAGPSVYDVVLPDSARMSFTHTRTFASSPTGAFLVYTAERGGTTELWYRSLRDDDAHPILGTEGGSTPTIAPDGRRMAFLARGQVWIVPIEGGAPRPIAESAELPDLHWVSDRKVLLADGDGKVLRWLDPEEGSAEAIAIEYCILPEPVGDRLLCGGGANKFARFVAPRDSAVEYLRLLGTEQSDTAGRRVRGSHFRIVDGRYLVYMSVGGDLRAAPIEVATGRVGRSVTMVRGVRRENYTGAGAYDLTPAGTLVVGLGRDAEVGRMVRFRPGHGAQSLPVELAAFQRFGLTRDGRRLAAVVEGLEEQELRIYDLLAGQRQVWLRSRYIGEPVWSPSGDRLVAGVAGERGFAVIVGSPTSAAPPETHLAGIIPTEWRDDGVIGVDFTTGRFSQASRLGAEPSAVALLGEPAFFPALSPDGRWVAYSGADNQLWLAPYPATGRRYLVDRRFGEPQWLSPTDLLYLTNDAVLHRVRLDAASDPPLGTPQMWLADSLFKDTPEHSYEVRGDGSVLYVQGPTHERGTHVRVVPNWVVRMKRAVDAANR